MKIKSFECPKSIRNYEKKILGTSDTWSTSHLSHRPSEPAYYIVDCRILNYVRLANITMAIYKVPIKHYWCNSRKAVLKEFVKLGLSILAQSSSYFVITLSSDNNLSAFFSKPSSESKSLSHVWGLSKASFHPPAPHLLPKPNLSVDCRDFVGS